MKVKNTTVQGSGLGGLYQTKLEQSKIDERTAKQLRFKLCTAEEVPPGTPVAAGGFVIPYFDLAGKPTEFWRYRYLESTNPKGSFDALVDHKPLRYVQAKGTINELYLPPLVDWASIAKDPSKPIVVTEGELKSACATAHTEYPTVGLGGVWCFRSAFNSMHLLPMFKKFVWKGRQVYIAYDSDSASNPKVMGAENAFARELLNLGADPFIVRVPVIDTGHKCGLDDYIAAKGGNGAFEDLLDKSSQFKTSKELHSLNEEVVYVRDPGMIIRMDNRQRIAPRAFVDHAFSTRVYHEELVSAKGEVKLQEKSAPREWLRWPGRAEVQKIVYSPGEPTIVQGDYNTWPGWGCAPKKGDVSLWKQLLNHICTGMAREHQQWFERWLACPLQQPGVKMYSSAVVWGLKHGTGKSFIGYSLFKLYGNNATEINDEHLHAAHNEWAENKQFVMGDEITSNDKRSDSKQMKSIITRQQLRLNIKYIPSFTVRDCINYYFTSNHPDAFFLEDQDRRYFIHEVLNQPLDDAFYHEYENWIGKPGVVGPGAPALFHHLLHLPMGDFDPRAKAPMTDSKRDMLNLGRSDLGSWVSLLRESPDTALRFGDAPIKHCLWRCEDLLRVYDPDGKGRVTTNGLARELRKQGFKQAYRGQGVPTKLDGQVRLWVVREVPEKIANSGKAGEWYDEERATKEKYK